MLRPDKLPTQKLPLLSTMISSPLPCRPIIQQAVHERNRSELPVHCREAGVNTEVTEADLELLEEQLSGLRRKVQELEEESAHLKEKQHFASAVLLMVTAL